MKYESEFELGNYLSDAAVVLATRSDSPRLDAEILLGLVLRKPRSYLHAWPERMLSEEERHRYNLLIRRRFSGEPMAYISGVREFWSMPLRVNRQVLIPRPETELLVEKALNHISEDEEVRVLELGSGCGAVSLAIAHERPKAEVIGVDISEEALTVARLNAKLFKIANVEFLHSNWFDAVRGQKFNVVVSNPPYVINRDEFLLAGNLRFEPELALAGGDDGLECFRQIIDRAHNYIVRQGWLLFEHANDQERSIRRLLEAQRYYDITCYQDAAGHDRVTECRFVE
ncbi:MAG: peptide chain release factor N(5)-glutamine methyltransferase [Gammaproteobacteria bacterium]